MISKPIHIHQKFHAATLVAALVYLVVLLVLVYGVARHQTGFLMAGYGLMFGLYLLLVWGAREVPLWPLMLLVVVARLLLLPAVPALSDDFYRFLWDGHLLTEGLHPFSHPPEWYRQAGAPAVEGLTAELYQGLNSKSYFTIYPPLPQALFALAAWIGGTNIFVGVLVLRLPLLVAELGTLWLMMQLLSTYQLPQRRVLLYALNPLVLLELTGNLHLETLAIFFLLLLVWAFTRKNTAWLSVAFAGAVASKLWPLLLGPYMLIELGWKKGLQWMGMSGTLLLLLFVPLFGTPLLNGMLSSLSLYYQRFEFNASLYYILRAAGEWIMGFNPIVQLGPILALGAAAAILYYSRRAVGQQWRIAETLMLLYGLFLLCATTVHPWYVLPLLALMPFTHFRFPLLWSALVFLTYAGYSQLDYQEPLGLVAVEYVVVLAFLWWEVKKAPQLHQSKSRGTALHLELPVDQAQAPTHYTNNYQQTTNN